MASLNIRSGAPTNLNLAPYITTAGIAGTSARVISLRNPPVTKYMRPVMIQNLDGTNVLFVKINASDASDSDCNVRILANGFYYIEHIDVELLSLYMAAGAYTTAMVYGWIP